MNKPYKTFETERLHLRPASLEDAAFIFELMNTPKWLQFIGDRNVKSIEDAKAYINKKMMPQLERLGYGNFIVIRKEDGVKIGSCGLYDREGLEGIDIGFAFLPPYEGKGYGYESAYKLKEAAVHEFGITTIGAITSHENIGSQKLLEKIGLTFEKIITLPGDDEELMFYKFVAEPNSNFASRKGK